MSKTELAKQIKIKDDTYEELTELGKKNETYDAIIRKCMQAYKKLNKL